MGHVHPSHGESASSSEATGVVTPERPLPPPWGRGRRGGPHPTAARGRRIGVGSRRLDSLPRWGTCSAQQAGGERSGRLPGVQRIPNTWVPGSRDISPRLLPTPRKKARTGRGHAPHTRGRPAAQEVLWRAARHKRTVSARRQSRGARGGARTLTWHSKEQHCGGRDRGHVREPGHSHTGRPRSACCRANGRR